MAEHTRRDITNSELPFWGTTADPNVAPAFENEEAEQAPADGDVLDNFDTSLSLADNTGQSEQSSNSADIPDNIQDRDNFYFELQEANNISKAAYKELMTIAFEAKTWIVDTPAMGSLDEFVQMFRSPPLPGKRVHCSTQSTYVRIHPDNLVSVMMDVDIWALTLSHIVSHKSFSVPPGVLLKLATCDEAIESMLLVDTEFQLPTPLVQPTKFSFWRCLRNILPNVRAIVDISRDYFPGAFASGSENICRRRPSGLLIRGDRGCSEVIWIENVEIPEAQSTDGIYSGLVNSNLAFSARRCVDALSWKLKRHEESRFSEVKIEVSKKAGIHLLRITETMKKVYLDIVSETPDEEKWVTFSYNDVRILKNSPDHADSGLNNYIAVTSFRLQAKPISVTDILVKKNMDIQWPRLLNVKEPEEVIRLATIGNCITLHKKVGFQGESTQDHEYLLRESSKDGFCFFVTSIPIGKIDIKTVLLNGSSGMSVQPSGFALVPDGPDGFQSDASLVTVAIQQLDVLDPDQAIPIMCDSVNAIIKEISEEVCKLSDTSS